VSIMGIASFLRKRGLPLPGILGSLLNNMIKNPRDSCCPTPIRSRIYAISIGCIIHRSYSSPGSQKPRPGSRLQARDSLRLGGIVGEVVLMHTYRKHYLGEYRGEDRVPPRLCLSYNPIQSMPKILNW